MGLIAWDQRIATGNPKIDDQHKSLVNAYNKLHEAMKSGKGKDEVGKTLLFLKDYTILHFRMEEALMKDSAYPGFAKHQEIHRDLIKQVSDLADKFQAGTTSLTLPVMDFLEDWLVRHIQGEDFRLAAYLKQK